MKVKLKKDVNLSSMDNYCELDYNVWVKLNQGKTVELEKVNKFIEDKVELISSGSKKNKKTKGD